MTQFPMSCRNLPRLSGALGRREFHGLGFELGGTTFITVVYGRGAAG